MGFMVPQWEKADYWRVETSAGDWIVPQDVCGEGTAQGLAPYVEGTIESDDAIYAEHGWIGRLSAPGYSDCTDWIACETEEDIKRTLAEQYDLCPACLADLNEDYACSEGCDA